MAKEKKPPTIDELEPGTDEWFKAFANLPYADQVSLLNQSGDQALLGEGEEEGFDFGLPGTGYTLPPELGGMTGAQLDPVYQQLLQFGGGANIPSYTAKGELEPYDLAQEAARNNLVQDQATSLADVILSSLSGPGALDPQSFAPIETKPTERIATPGLTQLDRYARAGGYKGYIAQKIRDEGLTDDEAISALYNFISTPDDPNVSEDARATKQAIIDSLPTKYGGSETGVKLPSGRGQQSQRSGGTEAQDIRDLYDETGIYKWANDLYTKVADDEANVSVGWQDPQSGFYYTKGPTYEDSPLTEKFRNLGLPTPMESYTDPGRLDQMYNAMAPNASASGAEYYGTQASMDQLANELQKQSMDIGRRNTETQALFGRTGGMQPVPQAPAPAAQVGPQGQAQGGVLSYGATGPQPAPQQVVPPGPGTRGGANMAAPRGGVPGGARFPLDPAMAGGGNYSTIHPPGLGERPLNPTLDGWIAAMQDAYQPQAPMENRPMQPILGLENRGGGFDFGIKPGEIQQRSMANAALNFFGNGKRGTKPVELNQGTANKSQKMAQEAKDKFIRANANRFQHSQTITPDQLALINASGNAQFQASRGRSPYVDAITQRLLGQRAVGLRGL